MAERAGKGAAADRARRRAWSYVDAGRYVAAIDEFHNTKANWFNGENVEGSILAMLALSRCYEKLHSHAAARYYAAGALFTALHVESERTAYLLGQAAFRVADTFYVAGEGITYVYSLCGALNVHHGTATDPHEWTKHSHVQIAFAHAAVLRAVARRIAPETIALIDDAISTWPLPQSDKERFRAMSEEEPWSSISVEEIQKKIASDLGQHPFSDVGPERSVTWSAFGIVWTIRCGADIDTWLPALEVAAAVQIVQVEFADADLLIIPSNVLIDVELSDDAKPRCVQLPDNGKLAWKVTMPKTVPKTSDEEYRAHFVGIVLMVLGQATALPVSKLDDLVNKRLERDLLGRVFSVRPLRELMMFAQPDNLDLIRLASETRPALRREFQPIEAGELKWRNGPGPGYSRTLLRNF